MFAVAPAPRETPREEVAGRLLVALPHFECAGIHRAALDFGQRAHGLLIEPHVLLAADVMSASHGAHIAFARLKPLPGSSEGYACAPTGHLEVVARSQAYEDSIAHGADVMLLRIAVLLKHGRSADATTKTAGSVGHNKAPVSCCMPFVTLKRHAVQLVL